MKPWNNRGSSLIELLVAMTVSVLVIGAIMVFMSSGTKNYQLVDREITLQMEVQTVSNQLSDMIISANHLNYTAPDANNKVLTIYYKGDPSYAEKRKVITYDGVKARLFLTSYNSAADEAIASPSLLADYITGFEVLPSPIPAAGTEEIKVKMKFEWQGQIKEIETVTVLRNKWVEIP